MKTLKYLWQNFILSKDELELRKLLEEKYPTWVSTNKESPIKIAIKILSYDNQTNDF